MSLKVTIFLLNCVTSVINTPKLDSSDLEPNIAREETEIKEAELKPPTEEIVLTEIDSEQSSPLTKLIEIPQPESVKITEDKIEIIVPQTKSPAIFASEPESSISLWLKKF